MVLRSASATATALAAVAVAASVASASWSPGGALTRVNTTPFPSSSYIVGARWTSRRFDPPANQSGDILPTVWSSNGGTYVLMDDGGVDVPVRGGLWRQSLARITGGPPKLRFRHVGDPSSPGPHTWGQIGGNRDNDDGPLGPYYSIGFVEAGGIFYATQQRNWNWSGNGPFTGLAGIAYSRDHGETWRFARKSFGPPLGNLSFLDGGAPGGGNADEYVYAIGSEREFNGSRLIMGRVRRGVANVTDPARWQWFAGSGTASGSTRVPQWTSSLPAAVAVLNWDSHITYPQMSYDRPLHRYLLTFTYSYSSMPPGVWRGGAELVILEAPTATGPFSFVARSSRFGPSNGYGAGIPSQWISRDGRDLWLKWAANFAGCARGLDCSGKYGFNIARVHLTTRPPATTRSGGSARVRVVAAVLSATTLPLLLALMLARRRGMVTLGMLRPARGPHGKRARRR